ncbi:MAG: hypothetical protein AABM42_13715 [Actinomycetota bacterium]
MRESNDSERWHDSPGEVAWPNDIKQNRRAGRFKRRGRAAVRSEWRLIAATNNLLKLHRHTLAAAAA